MKNNFQMYCISVDENDLNLIKSLNYIPVGLGKTNFSHEWMRDFNGENISHKNKWYTELTFHYYIWKNELINFEENTWIGFCAYRDFWVNENEFKIYKDDPKNYQNNNNQRYKEIDKICLKEIPNFWNNYDAVLGHDVFLNKFKIMKILKYGKVALLRNPKAIFKSGRTIRWHFDMFHGNGILDKASNLVDQNERDDFKDYINNETSFNHGCMFICKSKKLMNKFYNSLFPWLERCEKEFGFNLEGYGKTRIYAYLAERYIPFWFKKYSNCLVWPILSLDIPRKK